MNKSQQYDHILVINTVNIASKSSGTINYINRGNIYHVIIYIHAIKYMLLSTKD